MNWLNIVIIVAVVISALIGLRAGIIKAVLSLAGLIVGVILAGRYYAPLAGQLTFIPQAMVAKVVAFAIILVGVMVIAAVLARLLKWAATVLLLGWVNRLLAIWVKYMGIADVIAESGLAMVLLDRFPMVLALLPAEFDAVRSFFQ